LIAIITLDDPSKLKHALPFDGQLPKSENNMAGQKSLHKFRSTYFFAFNKQKKKEEEE